MSQTHAHPNQEPGAKEAKGHKESAAAETEGHSKSHAAHLDADAAPHTKPQGNLRQGAAPGALRQPPSVVSRIGKDHKGE
jgi:hypothetical protein